MDTLKTAVENWFLNSPAWPFNPDIEREVDAYMCDGCPWTREAVRDEMHRFQISRLEADKAELVETLEGLFGVYVEVVTPSDPFLEAAQVEARARALLAKHGKGKSNA